MGDIQFNGTPEEWDALVKKNKKQETLEEVEIISKQRIHKYRPMKPHPASFFIGFRAGAEWQQERMYSAEDMINFAEYCKGDLMKTKDLFNEYQSLQQFKKKEL